MDDPDSFMRALIKQVEERQRDTRKRTTRVTMTCFDGEYDFQLTWAGMMEIEDKAKVGIGAVIGQVLHGIYQLGEQAISPPTEGTFSPTILREVIRQGLIGGNKCRVDGIEAPVSAIRASMLVERYLSPEQAGTLQEAWSLAAAILHAAFEGVLVAE